MLNSGSSLTDLLAFDRDHVWHPYSSSTAPTPVRLVDAASGVRLRLREQDGTARDVIDGMSSWWAAIHGYAVPELDAAARGQLDRMSHVMFGGLTNEPAIRLCDRLIDLAPDHLNHVFLADTGSVSVEVALKMAWQVHAGTRRTKVFTIRGGYHGDTLAPMSVCDPVGGMHSLFRGVVPEQIFAPIPPPGLTPDPLAYDEWERAVHELWAAHKDTVASVIIEPVLQGAGGMRVYSPQCVRLLADLAREEGALLIFDEIATGFGRTGTLWAADRCGVTPDIMCVGKALTGGYCTLAAVLCTDAVATAVSNSGGALMHGPTFMGNPLACAIANASLDLLTAERLGRAARIEQELATALAPAWRLPHVADVRTLGAVGVIQLDRPVDVDAATDAALDAGVWLRPFRDLIYAMPPYASTPDDVAAIGAAQIAAAGAGTIAG